MITKNVNNSDIFAGYSKVIDELIQLILSLSQSKRTGIQADKIEKSITNLVVKVQKEYGRTLLQTIESTGTNPPQIFKNNPDLEQPYQIMAHLLKIINDKIILKKLEKSRETTVLYLVQNIFDSLIIDLFKRYTIENHKNIRHYENVIEKFKIVKNDLQKQLDSTYEIIKNTPIGLAGCDADLNVRLWNPIAANLTGYKHSDIIGKRIVDIFTESSRTVFLNQVWKDHPEIRKIKLNVQTKQGGIFNAFVLINSLKSELKQKIHYIINFFDSGKDEKIKLQLEKIEQLGAIARLSDAVMHDIRNPINVLALNIDVLIQQLTDMIPDGSESMTMINSINRQLSTLTDNLNRYIGYSKITELQLEHLDIKTLLDELIIEARLQLSGSKIELKYRPTRTRKKILGDRVQLIRVLKNLINNAKESIEGRGTITVYAQVRNKKMKLNIVDSGIGIKSENIENIFKPYFTDKEKGTGLGLFIVREVVRAHHGKVYCSSELNRGSHFTISIPVISE